MPYDENHNISIDRTVEKANKSGDLYHLGKKFRLDLERISEMTGIDFEKDYDPKKGMTKYPEKEDVINAFYKQKKR